MQLSFVLLRKECQVVGGVWGCLKVRLWMLEFAQDRPTFNMVKHVIILVGLIWEPAVIEEDVLQTFLTLGLGVDTNWGSCIESVGGRGCRAIGRDLLEARLPAVSE